MTDDPRDILKAAGVECAPLDSWENLANARFMTRVQWEEAAAELDFGDAAILALAKLVAKYKWQRDEAINLTADSEDEAMELLEDIEQGWRVECEAKPFCA